MFPRNPLHSALIRDGRHYYPEILELFGAEAVLSWVESADMNRQQRRAKAREKAKQVRQQDQAKRPRSHQRQQPADNQPSFWSRMQNHPLPWLIGFFSGVLALGVAIYQALAAPVFAIDGSDPSSPFSSMFRVKNESAIFTMTDTQMICQVNRLRTSHNFTITGIRFLDMVHQDIIPLRSAAFHCQVDASGAPLFKGLREQGIVEADIAVWVTYKTLWKQRISRPVQYLWDTKDGPARWVEAPIVD